MKALNALTLALILPASLLAREASFNGEAGFTAETNVLGLTVTGNSSELKIDKARIEDGKDVLTIASAQASLPSASLKTGLEFRDSHMREMVFAKADPSNPSPSLVLEIKDLKCPSSAPGKYACNGEGVFKLGPKSAPVKLNLNFSKSDAGALSGQADFEVKLADLQLPAPSKGGAQVEDPIKATAKFQEIAGSKVK